MWFGEGQKLWILKMDQHPNHPDCKKPNWRKEQGLGKLD
jgi:hypothetical protein